jgi:hypothetical protein
MHDSGPGWFATPFPYDSFIHNSTPVYPGALNRLLTQIQRILEINNLQEITKAAVEAVRESLVIGQV